MENRFPSQSQPLSSNLNKGVSSSSIEDGTSFGSLDFPPLSEGTGKEGGINQGWRGLFPNPRAAVSNPLKYTPPVEVDGKVQVNVQLEKLYAGMKKCANKVVGFFVGNRLSFEVVKIAVTKRWKFKQEVSIKLYNNSAFIFEFKEEEDRNLVLETGSIFITGKPFALRPWTQLLENSITMIKYVPIWVMIFGVPLHMWDEEGLGMIASYLGNPLYADDCTINPDRLAFARVCIEIDLNFSYPDSIPVLIDGKIALELQVEYQWTPSKCDSCKVFGHSTKSCSKNTRPKWNPKKKMQSIPVEILSMGATKTGAEMVGKKQGPSVTNPDANISKTGAKDSTPSVELSSPAKETSVKGYQVALTSNTEKTNCGETMKQAASISRSCKSPGKQGIASVASKVEIPPPVKGTSTDVHASTGVQPTPGANKSSQLTIEEHEVEAACEQPLQVSVEGCASGSGGGALELLASPPE